MFSLVKATGLLLAATAASAQNVVYTQGPTAAINTCDGTEKYYVTDGSRNNIFFQYDIVGGTDIQLCYRTSGGPTVVCEPRYGQSLTSPH